MLWLYGGHQVPAATLRSRHSQGLVRLGATFNHTSENTDSQGQATFVVQAWHVCGNEGSPATDELVFRSSKAGIARDRLSCGVDGLTRITNDASRGIVTKSGIKGAYIAAQLNPVLESIGATWANVTGKPSGMLNHIVVTDGSLRWGGLISPHLTHRFGGTVDIRPISTDGKHTEVGTSNYSKQGTEILIAIIKSTNATRIIFGQDLPGVTDVQSDHSDHIHVSWLDQPKEPWSISASVGIVTPSTKWSMSPTSVKRRGSKK